MKSSAMKRVFVSIDWDYFIPEDPMWDLGHRENRLFSGPLWHLRGHLFRKQRTNGREKDFWRKFSLTYPVTPPYLAVSDSHLMVVDHAQLHLSDTLVLIDQHHDCYTKDVRKNENVDCGTWVAAWLEGDPGRSVHWVVTPGASTDIPKRYRRRFSTITDSLDGLPVGDLVGLHSCRSSCWTPPWTDGSFDRFLCDSGCNLDHVGARDLADPLKLRWSLKDYRTMFAMHRASREAMKWRPSR